MLISVKLSRHQIQNLPCFCVILDLKINFTSVVFQLVLQEKDALWELGV